MRENCTCARCGRLFEQLNPFGGNLCPGCKNSVRYDGRGGGGGSNYVRGPMAVLGKIGLFIFFISVAMQIYSEYIVPIGIAFLVIFICRQIYRKTKKPGIKISMILIVVITVLIVCVLIVPHL